MSHSRYRCFHCETVVAEGERHNCVTGKQLPFAVSGKQEAEGWRGVVTVTSLLDAAQLRALAAECNRMADLFDERIDWDRIDHS